MRDAIGVRLAIVFAALAVSHTIESRAGLSIAKVVKQLRPLPSHINGATQTSLPAIPDAQRIILTNSPSTGVLSEISNSGG